MAEKQSDNDVTKVAGDSSSRSDGGNSKGKRYRKKRSLSGGSGSILHIVFILMLVIVVFGTLIGNSNENLTFSAFLEMLNGVPAIPTDWIKFGGWTTNVPVLRELVAIVQVALYLCVGLAQAITFIGYFLQFIFY